MLLNLHSYYSLRYGTLSLDELVGQSLAMGYDTVVLTDINNSTGSLDFILKARRKGLNALAGIEFRNGDDLVFIGIARNEDGFRELNELLSAKNRSGQAFPTKAPAFDNVFVVYPYGLHSGAGLRSNEYLGVRPSQINRLKLDGLASPDRCVMLATVSYARHDYRLHCQLRAIDHNLLLSQLESRMAAPRGEYFIERNSLLDSYADLPELIHNTMQLLDVCTFELIPRSKKNLRCFTGSVQQDAELLERLATEGLTRRYGAENRLADARVKRELELIARLGFLSYFLMTDDICRFARGRNFHYVGRGSGANSAVAYCLGITDVDPLELNLPFERFLNPKRQSAPDFDIDFSWKERDDVYQYLFDRYPEGQVALLGTMSTFRSRSILRELGKIYGLPKADIDRLVHDPDHFLNKNEVTATILSVYNQMADFPNQRTIHASGLLISERPLSYYAAMDYPPKARPVMQLDMYVAEDLGFDKFDILSQRGIGHIRECIELVRKTRGQEIDLSDRQKLFKDAGLAANLRTGNTVGCFYIESPAMRQLLCKLQCEQYLTLVAASSIVRPGVASSGMMQAYIERHRNPENIVYTDPVFQEQLGETYGIMVYQEDVMKIAHLYGGLDMEDADVLRRMMSGKTRNREALEGIKNRFFSNAEQAGRSLVQAAEVWRQMESFAGYSFNKAHSASFAIESYQSLFLKSYFPKEFMVSVLNNYGGFYNRKVYVNEASRAGANVCLPCINRGAFQASLLSDELFLGFDSILHLNEQLAQAFIRERKANGLYRSLEDFVTRTAAGLEQLIVLIRAGAFRFTQVGKKELLWEAHLLLSTDKHRMGGPLLFQSFSRKPRLPVLESSPIEDLYDELELIGFPVSGSAFDLARSSFRGEVLAGNLLHVQGNKVRMVGDFVLEKQVRTKNGQRMKFGTFFDAEGAFFDTIHYPESLKAFPLRGGGLYLLEGYVRQEYGYPLLEVSRCAKMPLKPDPRSE